MLGFFMERAKLTVGVTDLILPVGQDTSYKDLCTSRSILAPYCTCSRVDLLLFQYRGHGLLPTF
jgi:hypothetical protein